MVCQLNFVMSFGYQLVKYMMVESFNEAYKEGEMPNSRRQGVITLIEKPDEDRTGLENWRPISLGNVDTKIAFIQSNSNTNY